MCVYAGIMPAPHGFSAKNIRYFQGAQGVADGPSATFELGINGDAPSEAILLGLEKKLSGLWRSPVVSLYAEGWFQRACHGGDPGKLQDWVAALAVAFQWMTLD